MQMNVSNSKSRMNPVIVSNLFYVRPSTNLQLKEQQTLTEHWDGSKNLRKLRK